MAVLQSRPYLRWLVPLAVLVVVATTGLVTSRAAADPALPAKSAEQLLVDLQEAEVDGLSGTVVQQANLGLPELPGSDGRSADFNSLISGSHTLRVWYAGPAKARVALLGTLGESDLIRNGTDVWTWSSEENTASHRVLSDAELGGAPESSDRPADAPKTPQEAAQRFLALIGETTTVSTDRTVEVADRPAYELHLTPKDRRSLISSVRIAVDAAESVALRVQVFGRDTDKPAAEVAFSDVEFAVPDDAQFAFNPPPGVTVKEVPARTQEDVDRSRADAQDAREQARRDGEPTVVGEGWTSVVVDTVPEADSADGDLQGVLEQLPAESGAWGSGRVLRGTLFSAVLTDDGRLAVGAVEPELLFDALG